MQELNEELDEELDEKLMELYSSWSAYCLEGGHEPTHKDFLDCVKDRLSQLKISLNHCFTCDKGFSDVYGLNRHFNTKKHMINAQR